jgi:hypothetical protein
MINASLMINDEEEKMCNQAIRRLMREEEIGAMLTCQPKGDPK